MTHEELIGRLAPVTDEEAGRMVRPETRGALAEQIMATVPGRARAHRRRVLFVGAPLLAAGATAAVVASVVLSGSPGGGHSEPINARAAALSFSTQHGYLLVKVRDPLADPKRYKKEFAAHGMKIDLSLVPASPSVVGTVVMSDLPPSVKTVSAKGDCFDGGGGPCPVGVKIPLGFRGTGTIVFGRAARPGEKYASTKSAFAPGEELHCVDLRGRTVDEALRMLSRKKVTVALFHHDEKRADGNVYGVNTGRDKIPGSWYVSTADPWAPGQVMLWVRPDRPGPGEDAAYYRHLMHGCPR